ncbi:MAG: cytoplasmic protein [Desulfobacterales bacterium]
MLKKDLILRNPLKLIGPDEALLQPGAFCAVTARAGVGKTAFLVQIALYNQLRGKNVLHVSLNDPVRKVDLWYREVFRRLSEKYRVDPIDRLWEEILPHRFIMTFRVEGFSVPILSERLNNLSDQDIFLPHMVIIDGLPFDSDIGGPLSELKQFARQNDLQVWFTIRTHRHEEPAPEGIPLPLASVYDLFDVVLQLQPEGKEIHVRSLKGGSHEENEPSILLDPSTMLLIDS